ncbi:trypsin-like serine peptidase [Amycolatopsis umgeniensis]|uniref:Serine protease n=1 Tax=Amycolatopsis umgeniensis TaxID=336628 RepID=A0A841B185_9PSEU|nr:trypsin-like serine protease [Amycolatopsis umgeniensis]MBB5852372.1 glutamyl endopeptidase [Amycolatopsis umgeniensis]
MIMTIPSNAAAAPAQLPSTPISSDDVIGENAPPATISEIPQSKGTVGLSANENSGDVVAEKIFGKFPRTRQNLTTSFPSRTVVEIKGDGPDGKELRCSGWMIGPSEVATAGHCVHSGGPGGVWYQNLSVAPGRNGADAPYKFCAVSKSHTVLGWYRTKNYDYDYAVLKLNCKIGETVGWLAMKPNSGNLNGVELTHRGYPSDKQPIGSQWFTADTIRRSLDRQFGYRFDTAEGQSGGPVYRVDNRVFMAFAVHSSYDTQFDDNTGTRINQEVFDNYVAWLN